MTTATQFTPFAGLAGGLLIGLSATLLLLMNGRIAGISGILGGLLSPKAGDTRWRWMFVTGMLLGAACFSLLMGGLTVEVQVSWPWMIAAGFIVGFGTRLGSGCTSGHGVCGIARLSRRSLVATLTFMASAGVTVFVIRHVLVSGS